MPWARLDDQFHRHNRVQDALDDPAGPVAIGLYALALSWSYDPLGGGGTPFVPDRIPRRLLHLDAGDAVNVLVAVGLWEPTQGGWLIHDWQDYRPQHTLTPEQRAAGGRNRTATAQRGPDGRLLPTGGQPGGQPGGDQVDPGDPSKPSKSRWEPGGVQVEASRNLATNPNPVPVPEPVKVPRGVKGGSAAISEAVDNWDPAWAPFLDAWSQRFRLPPTQAQREALWEAVDAYPQASASFVLDCPPGTKAADVISSVLDRFHAIRDQANADAARREVQADADRIAQRKPRTTTGPARLSDVLADLPM